MENVFNKNGTLSLTKLKKASVEKLYNAAVNLDKKSLKTDLMKFIKDRSTKKGGYIPTLDEIKDTIEYLFEIYKSKNPGVKVTITDIVSLAKENLNALKTYEQTTKQLDLLNIISNIKIHDKAFSSLVDNSGKYGIIYLTEAPNDIKNTIIIDLTYGLHKTTNNLYTGTVEDLITQIGEADANYIYQLNKL